MQGVNILNQIEIMEHTDTQIILAGISAMCFIIFLLLTVKYESAVSGAACFGWFIAFFIFGLSEPTLHTGRYRYECTIDKSVSIQDVYDNYEVIEQRGELWILEDKEEE